MMRVGQTPATASARRQVAVLTILALALLAVPAAYAAFEITAWKVAKVPPLQLVDLEGNKRSLAAYNGRVVVINFWATWCEPCRAEMPSMEKLAKRLGPGKIVFLAVNYQEHPDRIRRFLERTPVTFPVLLDSDGAATKAWTRRIFPTSVVVGTDGMPRHIITGEYDWDGSDAARLLEPLLKSSGR